MLALVVAAASLNAEPSFGRRQAVLAIAVSTLPPAAARADSDLQPKLRNLPAAKLAEIVRDDLVQRQFLATGDFTRAIYDEGALFTDEIDTYTLPKFIKGTSALFVPSRSKVFLVGDVMADANEVSFRFDEDLCFNIPFNPVVTVTGRCVLTRDPESGLVVKYREYWDNTPNEVVLTAFKSKPQRS